MQEASIKILIFCILKIGVNEKSRLRISQKWKSFLYSSQKSYANNSQSAREMQSCTTLGYPWANRFVCGFSGSLVPPSHVYCLIFDHSSVCWQLSQDSKLEKQNET